MCTHNITHPNRSRVPLEHLPINRKPISLSPNISNLNFHCLLFSGISPLCLGTLEFFSTFIWTKNKIFTLFCFKKREQWLCFLQAPLPDNHWLKSSSLYLNNPALPPPVPCPALSTGEFKYTSVGIGQLWRAESRCQASALWPHELLQPLDTLYPKDEFSDQEGE